MNKLNRRRFNTMRCDAIQLEGDKFLVCHYTPTHDRVCMIDNTDRVIKCYGGNQGTGIGQLNLPFYLAIDRNGFIFVADYGNDCIVRLNSSLEYIGETVGINQPHHITSQRGARTHVCHRSRWPASCGFRRLIQSTWVSFTRTELSSIVWCIRS